MRPVSDKFLASLRGSHSAVAQAFVVATGQTGVSPTGTEVPILGGDVQLDANAAIRSTLGLDTDGTGTFPDNASDLFTPYGDYELFIRKGLYFGGGAVEWVSMGYFRPNDVEQDNAPDGPLRIAAQDRMAGILDGDLLAPIQFASTAKYGDVVEDLVQEIYPWATIEWDDGTYLDPLGRSLIADDEVDASRYTFLNDLVTSLGKIWYWDYRGVLVIKDLPPQDEPVWEVNSGENGVLVSRARSISREGVYNAVVAYGEALDDVAPSRAVAIDNSPASPTYFYGSFGKVPRRYSSPFITTDAQAKSAAEAILRQNLGLPYNVNFRSIVNPALEPLDAVAVTLNAFSETHVLETLAIPLRADEAMTATTREQTLVVIGEV
jgi:hypothetical protein